MRQRRLAAASLSKWREATVRATELRGVCVCVCVFGCFLFLWCPDMICHGRVHPILRTLGAKVAFRRWKARAVVGSLFRGWRDRYRAVEGSRTAVVVAFREVRRRACDEVDSLLHPFFCIMLWLT